MASRLENSARNVLVALCGQAFSIILAFVTRGIFARQLSLEYMGLENLFSNVLTILSLADLGVASAIIFALYRPLAEENHEQVRAIMRLFRNVYVIIGLVIIAAGLVLTPYIDVLIKDTPDIPYLKLYFFMFVANTGISYFFSYKGCLIAADQKKYIVSLNQYAFQIVMCIAANRGALRDAQLFPLFVLHGWLDAFAEYLDFDYRKSHVPLHFEGERQAEGRPRNDRPNQEEHVRHGAAPCCRRCEYPRKQSYSELFCGHSRYRAVRKLHARGEFHDARRRPDFRCRRRAAW